MYLKFKHVHGMIKKSISITRHEFDMFFINVTQKQEYT